MGRGDHRPTHSGWRELGISDIASSTINDTDMLGGDVIRLIAGSATLLVGEIVYISASRVVTKVPTATTNHPLVAGVVVGGWQTQMAILHDSNIVGQNAALTGEPVIICINGVAYVVADAAIVAGTQIAPSTTVAGRVRPAIAFAAGVLSGAPALGTLVVSGAPALGTLAVTGAPAIGTLDATVDAGAVAVTSSAANGAIATVVGAPAIGTLAVGGVPAIGSLVVSGAPTAGTLAVAAQAGDGLRVVIGYMLEASSAAADVRLARIRL